MGVIAGYIILTFGLSFAVDYLIKRKKHKEPVALLRALLVSVLTTATPIIISVLVLVYGGTIHKFLLDNLVVPIALLIFMPLASYFSYRRLIK